MVDECLGCHPALWQASHSPDRGAAPDAAAADMSAVGGEQRHPAAVRPGVVNASDQGARRLANASTTERCRKTVSVSGSPGAGASGASWTPRPASGFRLERVRSSRRTCSSRCQATMVCSSPSGERQRVRPTDAAPRTSISASAGELGIRGGGGAYLRRHVDPELFVLDRERSRQRHHAGQP